MLVSKLAFRNSKTNLGCLKNSSTSKQNNNKNVVKVGKPSTIYLLFIYGTNYKKTAIRIGPRQANLVLIANASSEGSGEPAHPRSLARTSAARSYKQ